jgi:hypothetical protein
MFGPAMVLAAAVAVLGYSALTGPSFEELSRLEAVERAADVVRAVAHSGIGELATPAAKTSYSTFDARGTLPVLLGAWAELSLGRLGWLDPLTSARLPWLLVASFAPALVFALVVPSRGPFVAALAGLLLLATPHFCHAAAVTSAAVTESALWLVVLVLHQRAVLSRGRVAVGWSLAAAAALGAGAALTLGVLWVVPLALVHHWLTRRPAVRRLVRSGRLPLPAFVPAALLAVPLSLLILNPALWGTNVVGIARWVLAPLAPSVSPAPYFGRLVTDLPVPFGFVATWLWLTLPAATLLCALVGLAAIGYRGLSRRFATGRFRPPRDRTALGSLVVLGLAGTVLGPACVPAPLATFPPAAEAALPFVAVAAAIGLDVVIRAALPRRPIVPAMVVVGALAWLTVREPRTAAASFNALFGGAQAVRVANVLPVGDGSELAALAPALDGLGRARVALAGSDAPPTVWRVLAEKRRMKTTVVAAEHGGLLLLRGDDGGPALARVERDGAVLWTLRETR